MGVRPSLFNRLGSGTQITHSVFGNHFAVGGGAPTYAATKFGNGIKTTNGNYVRIVPMTTESFLVGCIELWFKPDGWSITNGVSSDAGIHTFWMWHKAAVNSFHEAAVQAGGFSWRLRDEGVDHNWLENLVDFDVADGELAHLACTWDNSHGTKKRRVFLNGSEIGSENTGWTDADMSGAVFYMGTNNSAASSIVGYEDNVKWWPYAKESFNDRHSERGGLNDLVIAV